MNAADGAPSGRLPRGTAMAGAGRQRGYVAAIASLEGVGPSRARWLLARGSPAEVWRAIGSGGLPRVAGGPPGDLLRRWSGAVRRQPDLPDVMEGRIASFGLDVLVGDRMPSLLRADPDPPAALFVAGQGAEGIGPTVAIVGTRRASGYGLRMAAQLGRDLSEAGITVVSGLALGIDAAAHSGALDAAAPVVAVIGAGHDRPCPARNRSLAREVSRRGLVVGEVPPGVASAPWRYPVRNRLIAALSQLVVVVESASRGGSMSTVTEALSRDRPVMAVPGAVGRASSEGCHDLLRDGAEICTGADDVLLRLGLGSPDAQPHDLASPGPPVRAEPGGGSCGPEASTASPGDLESRLLDELADSALTLDSVVLRVGAPVAAVASAVATLERRGLVTSRAGWLERT